MVLFRNEGVITGRQEFIPGRESPEGKQIEWRFLEPHKNILMNKCSTAHFQMRYRHTSLIIFPGQFFMCKSKDLIKSLHSSSSWDCLSSWHFQLLHRPGSLSESLTIYDFSFFLIYLFTYMIFLWDIFFHVLCLFNSFCFNFYSIFTPSINPPTSIDFFLSVHYRMVEMLPPPLLLYGL